MKTIHSIITVSIATVIAAATLTGCSTWIKYPDDYEPPATADLGDFPEVEHLDHLALEGLLARHTVVDDDYVLIDYDAIADSPESLYLLDLYVAMINSVDPTDLADAGERLAYWINGYNASVIKGVVDNYDGDHGFSVLDSGVFFDDPIYGFGGVLLSLNQVEHGVLRGKWEFGSVASTDEETLAAMQQFHDDVWGGAVVDARIHAALNCASLGCPNLPGDSPYAYPSEGLDERLEQIAVAWVHNETKGAGPDGISQIFDWYGADFVDDYGSIDAFIEMYREDGLDGVDLESWLEYDWSLNIAS